MIYCVQIPNGNRNCFKSLIRPKVISFFCRRNMLEKKLADAEVSEEEQHNLLQHLEKKEREIMRLQRHKMGADDFEPLTMIGKGAFGEVYFIFVCI